MTEKPMYEYITELLDFTELIAKRITPGDYDNGSYFMTLVYVEDILDKYGRGLVLKTANEDNLDGNSYMAEVTRRMDVLRNTIATLNADHSFNEVLSSTASGLVKNWAK